jgi:cytoskeletal protein CcmA (bactofilin family)
MKSTPNQVVTNISNSASDRILTVGTVNDEQQDLNAEANLTFDGTTLTVTGNLNVTGNTTTATNTTVTDKLIELANGTSGTPSGDAGIIIERGSSANAGIIWDESGDTFVIATTTATGASTGDLTLTDAALKAGSLDISGNVDIDGTANLDAVDIDGAVQIDNTVTVGANDQGYDVIFYGDTASANVTWDTSEDDLILNGAARVVVPDGQLVLGSTAVTSTAAELNILDGKSFVDEDNMASNSATAIASQQSIKAYVDAQVTAQDLDFAGDSGGALSIDLDSESLTIAGGAGITTTGSSNTLTVAADAAQTGITSILNTSLVVGRDADNQIKFGTDNEIIFEVSGGDGVTFKASGEIEATSLDISGDADIDGTLEADAITVDGVALAEVISDTVGAMVGSNTETGITVSYDDSDNTLDFVLAAVGTNAISDNAVTLAKLAGIARGKIIYGDANGDPAVLAVGNADQVLTTDGTDISWQDASGGSTVTNDDANLILAIQSFS